MFSLREAWAFGRRYGEMKADQTKEAVADAVHGRVPEFMEEGMINMVTGFVALAVVLGIAVVVLSSVSGSMPTIANTSAYYGVQSTIDTSTVNALGLLVVVLIIVAAACLMGAIRLIRA